jgi:hypothetical protein
MSDSLRNWSDRVTGVSGGDQGNGGLGGDWVTGGLGGVPRKFEFIKKYFHIPEK